MVRVTLVGGEESQFEVAAQCSLLVGAEQGGRSCIPVGCRGGGCGLCKVRVLDGAYRIKRMSRAHISEVEAANGYVLACRVFPLTDVVIELAATESEAQ
ncbi:2Fe-2S iron-sulfur cluster-binding protein [Marinobacterium aestuariivivens]|uniref:2Fe-2S iron-sulfur cluster-binding protein n=1 Tax=Marinobacterium aestuariivivens TaxID=1698799 RepID=A0ABW1ZUP9_9GAMM